MLYNKTMDATTLFSPDITFDITFRIKPIAPPQYQEFIAVPLIDLLGYRQKKAKYLVF